MLRRMLIDHVVDEGPGQQLGALGQGRPGRLGVGDALPVEPSHHPGDDGGVGHHRHEHDQHTRHHHDQPLARRQVDGCHRRQCSRASDPGHQDEGADPAITSWTTKATTGTTMRPGSSRAMVKPMPTRRRPRLNRPPGAWGRSGSRLRARRTAEVPIHGSRSPSAVLRPAPSRPGRPGRGAVRPGLGADGPAWAPDAMSAMPAGGATGSGMELRRIPTPVGGHPPPRALRCVTHPLPPRCPRPAYDGAILRLGNEFGDRRASVTGSGWATKNAHMVELALMAVVWGPSSLVIALGQVRAARPLVALADDRVELHRPPRRRSCRRWSRPPPASAAWRWVASSSRCGPPSGVAAVGTL